MKDDYMKSCQPISQYNKNWVFQKLLLPDTFYKSLAKQPQPLK